MADDANIWDWRKNLPPIATIFPQLGTPSMAPFTEIGTPSMAPAVPLTRPYTAPPPAAVGPGYTPNLTAPGVTGVKMPSGVPLGDFGNPAPKAADGQPPAEDPDAKWKREFLEKVKNGDFTGGLAALAKATGGGGTAAASHPFHVSAPQRMGGGKDLSQAGGNLMSKALADMAAIDLTQPIKRKGNEQDRYDRLKRG